MKIGYLGTGAWGYCLASLLAEKGYDVIAWSIDPKLIEFLSLKRYHPKFPQFPAPPSLTFTTNLKEALDGINLLVESVTSSGIRPVFTQVRKEISPHFPIVLTSKGIEQGTGLLLSDVAADTLEETHRSLIGCISGPSHAEEVIKKLPSSVTCSAYSEPVIQTIQNTFTTSSFRVYPNRDINGVEFGGAMKNIIAIACGLSDGLGFGDNTKAALITRGLHEIRKLSKVVNCQPDTLNGLSGLGDLCVTCLSKHSRNYQFGRLISQELAPEKAKEKIGQAVEGAYTCVSAMQLSKKENIPVPITECIYNILYEKMNPKTAVQLLMTRSVKEESL